MAPAGKKVFATSTTYNGSLGSISGAHAKCQSRASAAGLAGTSTASNSQWTMTSNTGCNNSFRLYCFEQ